MTNKVTDRIGAGGWRGGLLLVVLVIVAYYIGSTRSGISVHTGRATSASGSVVYVEADDWTYSVPLDGIVWYDSAGGHNGGRPTCLPAEDPAGPVTFGTVDTANDGVGIKAVIWVDCR